MKLPWWSALLLFLFLLLRRQRLLLLLLNANGTEIGIWIDRSRLLHFLLCIVFALCAGCDCRPQPVPVHVCLCIAINWPMFARNYVIIYFYFAFLYPEVKKEVMKAIMQQQEQQNENQTKLIDLLNNIFHFIGRISSYKPSRVCLINIFFFLFLCVFCFVFIPFRLLIRASILPACHAISFFYSLYWNACLRVVCKKTTINREGVIER